MMIRPRRQREVRALVLVAMSTLGGTACSSAQDGSPPASMVDGAEPPLDAGAGETTGANDDGASKEPAPPPLPPGEPDPTFGTGGRMTIDTTSVWELGTFAVNPDGKVFLGGIERDQPKNPLVLAFDDKGPDASFGSGGRLTLDRTRCRTVLSIAFGSGKELALGLQAYSKRPTSPNQVEFGAAKASASGKLATSFGLTGYAGAEPETDAFMFDVTAVHHLADGGVVAGGTSFSTVGYGTATVAKFLANGSLDETFANGGVRVEGGGYSSVLAFGTDDNGRVRSLESHEVDGYELGTSRFDIPGFKRAELYGLAVAAVAHPKGGFLAVGTLRSTAAPDPEPRYVLARIAGSGLHDTTFGVAGFADLGMLVPWPCHYTDLAVDTKDRTVLISKCDDDQTRMVRVLPSGQLDTTFGDKGVVVTDISAGHVRVDGSDRIFLYGSGRAVKGLYVARFVP